MSLPVRCDRCGIFRDLDTVVFIVIGARTPKPETVAYCRDERRCSSDREEGYRRLDERIARRRLT